MNRQNKHKRKNYKSNTNNSESRSKANEKPPQIFIGGCHPDLKRSDLKSYFSQFGQIKECRLMMDRKTSKVIFS